MAKSASNWFKSSVFTSNEFPRFLALVALGIPVGLIFVFIINTIQFWFKSYDLSKAAIGIFSFAMLPNGLKFLWAPFLELTKPPILRHFLPNRHGWAVLLLIIISGIFGVISFQTPSEDILLLFSLIGLAAIFTASLEINLDAIRIELIPKKHQGPASAFYAFGYRIGNLVGSTGIIYISKFYSWHTAFGTIITLLLLSAVALVFFAYLFHHPFDPHETKKRTKLEDINHLKIIKKAYVKFKEPFISFTHSKHWIVVFCFILTFRMGDNFINNMANIFYMDIGFSQLDIADVVKTFGVIFTVLGTFLGGYLVKKKGDLNAMLISGFIHVLSNIMYMVLSYTGKNFPLFYMSVAIENATGGMTTTAFVAYLSNLCRFPYTGSHYALFSSIWYLSTSSSGIGGIMAEFMSWPAFFTTCIFVGIAPLGLIMYLKRINFLDDLSYNPELDEDPPPSKHEKPPPLKNQSP